MHIHRQLVLAPEAMASVMRPAWWTGIALLALAALVCGVKAARGGAPALGELASFELSPLSASSMVRQRTGSFATHPVDAGEALILRVDDSLPPALARALLPVGRGEAGLRIHSDLALGPARLASLSRPGLRWQVSVLDKQVVRIASADGELLPYREFRAAAQARRWRLAGIALACGVAAGFFTLRLRRR